MCGIAGIRHRDGHPVEMRTLRRFTRSLAHRGPDGEGAYIDADACLGLGHRRLSILDRTANGDQPMHSLEGRYTVVYNGEIYNFLELRDELETFGYRFRTTTDTEVIAAAYDRWGDACELRFNGMWAFALWDARARTLVLSRDRFGVKPLYYLEVGHRFAFASELKAFLALDGFDPCEETSALARALRDPLAAEAFAQTPLRGVMKLMPGHRIVATHERTEMRRWWNTLDHRSEVPRTFAAQSEALRELLFDATRLRLRSDVPIGIALSGGLDSSSIIGSLAALTANGRPLGDAARRAPAYTTAFTATFAGTPLDERAYARRSANAAGFPLHEIAIDAAATAEQSERIAFDIEEPTMTDPAPIWTLYREMRSNGVSVALNGDGADELFCGYMHHVDYALERAGGMLAPRRFADLIATRCGMMPSGGDAMARVRLAAHHDPKLRALARSVRAMRGRGHGARDVATYAHRERSADDTAVLEAERREAAAAGLSPLGAHLYGQFHATTLPGILRMFDRASMAHGVEIRSPFLDWRIVRFAFSLPDTSRVGGGYTKRVLREAMRGIVPEPVRTRREKIGFNAPLPQWFAGERRAWLWERVNAASFLESDLWDGPALRDTVRRKRDGEAWAWGEGEALWSALAGDRWRGAFLTRDRAR